jgi:hypothetical protein
MAEILDKLRGGDLRSIGRANEVVNDIKKDTGLFAKVFEGLYHDDPIIRMRSADVIEKVTRSMPELLHNFKDNVISLLASSDQQEVCWHLAQIAPRLSYKYMEEQRVINALKQYLSHNSKIVRVSAMDALATLAERNHSIIEEVIKLIKSQLKQGSPSIVSRGKKLLETLERMRTNV